MTAAAPTTSVTVHPEGAIKELKVKPINHDEIKEVLGEGPMRFAPVEEKTFSEQLDALTSEERACYDELKSRWEKKDRGFTYPDDMYLRFARCSPGSKKFNAKSAWKVMKNYDPKYLEQTAASLENQLLSKTLFIPPGLKSSEGHSVFYMRPSRYFPKVTSTQEIIDNLVYCMQVMVEEEKSCTEGIGFLANMAEWDFSNFSVSYCYQFMMMLQGRVPVRVRLFLIVNPPSWFGKIWKIMRPMLSDDFAKKVHVIKSPELSKYMADDFETYLPDDMENGKAPTEAMVSDFIAYRKHVEGSK